MAVARIVVGAGLVYGYGRIDVSAAHALHLCWPVVVDCKNHRCVNWIKENLTISEVLSHESS